MATDEELLAQMALQEESPDDPRQRRVVKPKYAKSEFEIDDLRNKIGDRVWVKCITDLQPWADEKPLKMWKDYFIKIEEAILLDEKRFAVILHSQEAMKTMVTAKTTVTELATSEKPSVKPTLKLNQPK